MKKQTLKKFLEKLNKDGYEGNIYLGGKLGNGFFYIGPISDTERIELEYKRCYDSVINSRETALDTLRFHFEAKNKFRNEEVNEYERLVLWGEMIGRTAKTLRAHEGFLKRYKDNVFDTKVEESYEKQDIDYPGLVILIDNSQKGKYWFPEEMKAQ